MDHLYAKIKSPKRDQIRRVLSDATLYEFEIPSLSSCIEYSPGTLLEEDEWFKIDSFSNRPFFPKYLKKQFISADIEELGKSQFGQMTLLISDQGGDYHFQRIMPSTLLLRKVLSFGDTAYVEPSASRILVNPRPDAVYLQGADVLIFRDLARVSPVFLGIDTLFREATAEQVQEFLDQDFVVTQDFGASDVSKPNRKRITLALASLGQMSPQDQTQIFEYIRQYCAGTLKSDDVNNAFTVTSDEDVKNLVYGIEERFYTTAVRRERRIANSVIRI